MVCLLACRCSHCFDLYQKQVKEITHKKKADASFEVSAFCRNIPAWLGGPELAIARGLLNRPPVVLADESTAPLDSQRSLG